MRVLPALLALTLGAGCAARAPVPPPTAEVPGVQMSVEQFREIYEDAKAIPGAQVDTTGVLLASVFIPSPPERRAMYLFTLPAHPAHPAFLLALPTDGTDDSTTLTGGYAGSRAEYELLFHQLLARLRQDRSLDGGEGREAKPAVKTPRNRPATAPR